MKHLLIGTVALLFAIPTVARACSCAAPPPPKRAMEQSAAVFVAKVTKIERGDFGNNVTMEISTLWKGAKEKTVTVLTGLGGGDCGYGFVKDKSYLVYAYQGKKEDGTLGPLSTGICSRTRPLDNAADDIEALGPAKMPPL